MRIVIVYMTHVTLFEGWKKSSYGNLTSNQEMGCNGNAMHSNMQVSFPLAWLYHNKHKFILNFVILRHWINDWLVSHILDVQRMSLSLAVV